MTARELHVGRALTWPAKLASQAIGVLGMRGAGKSNLGRVYAEELFASKIPFVVFDPIGNWYGIRAGRDGRPGGGIPVPIFGGEHGDLPLDRSSGQRIADLVLERKLSCVLDLSHADFSETDKRRFLIDFGERLFRKKSRESGWLTLIMEEADDYAPQTTRGGGGGSTAETLGMFQRLVKRGRFKGLGALLITQRSAAINKDLLYMVGTLIVFRTTGPRDQDAVGGWVKHNAISEKVLETLSSLEAGEAWVISPDPDALETIARSRFRHMTTFDTGATPEHGAGGAKPATLADIDVPALSKELSAAVEKARAEDPRELQRKVAELTTLLARKEKVLAEVDARTKVIDEKLQRVTDRQTAAALQAQRKALEEAMKFVVEISAQEFLKEGGAVEQAEVQKALDAAVQGVTKLIERKLDARNQQLDRLRRDGGRILKALTAALGDDVVDVKVSVRRNEPFAVSTAPRQRAVAAVAGAIVEGVGKGETTILTAAAQHSDGVTREQLTVLTGYKRSSRDTYIQRLRAAGYVDQQGELLMATDAGMAALGPTFEPLPTGPALRDHWLGRLPAGEKKILEALIDVHPSAVDRGALDVGFKRSSRDTYIQRLAARQLVKVERGEVRASDNLF